MIDNIHSPDNLNNFDVLVEISLGSQIKYEFNEELGRIRVDGMLFDGVKFPFDYGSILGTKEEDGDPLDVMIYSTYSFPPGVLVPCRIIGAMDIIDRGLRDTKLLGIPVHDRLNDHLQDISDFPTEKIDEYKIFYERDLAKQRNKIMEFKGLLSKEQALALIESSRNK